MITLDSIEHLAHLIRFHRKQAGVTQVDLASIAGVSRKVIQDLEAARDGVSWRNLTAVLQVLNVKLQPVGPLIGHWAAETGREAQAEESSKSDP